MAPALALVAAACWGAGDFAGGIATRLSNPFAAVMLSQGVGLVLSAALLLMAGETVPGDEALVWAGFAGVFGAFGLGCFYLALSRGTMGLVAPLTALLAAAWPAAVGLATGGEVGAVVLAGMAAALAAVVLIALPDRRLGTPLLPTYHGSRGREWLLIVAASAGFGGFFLAVDASHAAGGETWWPLLMIKLAGTVAVATATLSLLPVGRTPAFRIGTAALVAGGLAGVADLGGNLFFLRASDVGELAVVVVLASLYPVGTAILARAVLHERLGRVRMVGVGMAVLGVVLIGAGSA